MNRRRFAKLAGACARRTTTKARYVPNLLGCRAAVPSGITTDQRSRPVADLRTWLHMAKSKGKRSGSGRLSWDGRLWDPSGVLYEREVEELTRSGAFDLVSDPDIQVAVSHASHPLRWLAPDQRQRVWRKELAPNCYDEPDWKPPDGAPGQLPFHAELWKSGARCVVLLTDRD